MEQLPVLQQSCYLHQTSTSTIFPDATSTIPISVNPRSGKEEDWLHFLVSDNGAGIDEKQLKALRDRLDINEKPDPGKSVGIVNVYKRLYLYYEGHLEFTISSKISEGTCVKFRIPYERTKPRP